MNHIERKFTLILLVFVGLSDFYKMVLFLYWISFGKTSWEISQILDISPRTANKHLEQIYKKLGVDNKTSAAAIALRLLER